MGALKATVGDEKKSLGIRKLYDGVKREYVLETGQNVFQNNADYIIFFRKKNKTNINSKLY